MWGASGLAMRFTDTLRVDDSSVRITRDGYLVASALTARTGVQSYTAKELGLKDRDPTSRVRVYRPPSAVFADKALQSMAYRPITKDGHPKENVTADNWKRLSAGNTSGDILRDGDYVRIPLMICDAEAIKDWRAGRKELSWGYDAEISLRDGVVPDGELDAGQQYDAVQDDISANHLAMCDAARGGEMLRIGDENPGNGAPKMKIIIVDGIPVADVSDAAEAVITTLQKRLADALALVAARDEAIAKHVADASTQAGEIAGLKKNVEDAAVSPAKLEAMVRDRALVIDAAKRIAGEKLGDTTGLTDAAIRKAAVTSKLGDEAVKDMDDGAIAGAFKALTPIADASDDGIRNVLRDAGAAGAGQGIQDAKAKAEKARQKYHDELANPPKAA